MKKPAQSGFTLVEMVVVLIVAGMLASFSLPRLYSAVYQTNARSARVVFANLAAKARAVAVQRGCLATLNFTSGSKGAVWVTSCKLSGSGVDTVGPVERLSDQFGVTVSSAASSIQYDPRGLSTTYQTVSVVFTAAGNYRDSTLINPFGMVLR